MRTGLAILLPPLEGYSEYIVLIFIGHGPPVNFKIHF